MINTLAGEFNFRSPEMRRSGTLEEGKARYDPHKSDVYSLGMTVLAMAKLRPFSTIGEISISEVPSAVQSLNYHDDLKRILDSMLQENPDNRPDFVKLKEILKVASELDDITVEIQGLLKVSTDASSVLALGLEDLWTSALLKKWHIAKPPDFASAQFYLRKLELEEALVRLGAYEEIAKLQSYIFPFIPISEIVTEDTDQPVFTLVIERKTGTCDFEPIHQINGHCGEYQYSRDGATVLFTVRKEYSLVTISEPPIPRPIVLVLLPSNQPIFLSKLQQYRLGDCLITVNDIAETEITLGCRAVDTPSPFLIQTFSASAAPFFIGRGESCSIRLQLRSVSSRHAELRVQEKAWALVDQKSTNGTLMYCHKVGKEGRESDEVQLRNEQVVNYQNEYFRFRLAS